MKPVVQKEEQGSIFYLAAEQDVLRTPIGDIFLIKRSLYDKANPS